VLTAFNVLEEALWRRTIAEATPAQLVDAIGMISTVLGAGKSSLSCAYVALASRGRVPSLDLTALFRGTA
jgi:ribulose 1,5-bisphosphate synthetase/thiazole synthase